MATSSIYLSGGPCNGRTVPASEIQGGLVAYIACGGGYYVNPGTGRRRRGDLIFTWAGTTKPGPPSGGEPTAAHSVKAWGDLRTQVNEKLPAMLHHVEQLRRGSLSRLARRHRVRG